MALKVIVSWYLGHQLAPMGIPRKPNEEVAL